MHMRHCTARSCSGQLSDRDFDFLNTSQRKKGHRLFPFELHVKELNYRVSGPKGGGEMKEKKQLLTPNEVAAMLQIARKTIIVMARERRLPCIRVGRLVRFDPVDIERWINSQRS